jgi:nucleoid-associated protein YgaU
MKSPSSRHHGRPTYVRPAVAPGARAAIELCVPRFPQPGEPAVVHRVAAGDRLDLLAARYYGDPLQSWRIVDANGGMDPFELLEPGRTLVIPRAD